MPLDPGGYPPARGPGGPRVVAQLSPEALFRIGNVHAVGNLLVLMGSRERDRQVCRASRPLLRPNIVAPECSDPLHPPSPAVTLDLSDAYRTFATGCYPKRSPWTPQPPCVSRERAPPTLEWEVPLSFATSRAASPAEFVPLVNHPALRFDGVPAVWTFHLEFSA